MEIPAPLVAATLAVPGVGFLVGAVGGGSDTASPLLGGIAAIITALGTFTLGLLALLIRKRPNSDSDADAWRAIAEQLLRERQNAAPAATDDPDPTEELPDASP